MTRLDDLQTWLALEHEAVWLYGMIGARVDGLARPARTSYDAHRVVRWRAGAGGGQAPADRDELLVGDDPQRPKVALEVAVGADGGVDGCDE